MSNTHEQYFTTDGLKMMLCDLTRPEMLRRGLEAVSVCVKPASSAKQREFSMRWKMRSSCGGADLLWLLCIFRRREHSNIYTRSGQINSSGQNDILDDSWHPGCSDLISATLEYSSYSLIVCSFSSDDLTLLQPAVYMLLFIAGCV